MPYTNANIIQTPQSATEIASPFIPPGSNWTKFSSMTNIADKKNQLNIRDSPSMTSLSEQYVCAKTNIGVV